MTTPQSFHQSSPGSTFEPFPASVQDTIDQKLRQSVGSERKPVQSVRPERRGPVIPQLVTEPDVVPATIPVAATPVQSPNGMVENEAPPVTPMSVADMVSIDLPSKFAYYPFKDLYVKPFRVTHLAKLAKASDVDSAQLTCEVVSSVLATPGGDKDIGFKLCVADFQAILYWLRAESFSKGTMRVECECGNPEHHRLVHKGEKPKESLRIESVHEISKLSTKYLDAMPDPEKFHVVVTLANGETRRVDLRPETMMDSIEFLDDPRLGDEEFHYTARIASYLDMDSAFPITEGPIKRWTLQDKIKVVEEYLSNDQALLVLEFSDLVDSFGVVEMVDTKCKECGHVEPVKLTIDARTFSAPRF